MEGANRTRVEEAARLEGITFEQAMERRKGIGICIDHGPSFATGFVPILCFSSNPWLGSQYGHVQATLFSARLRIWRAIP